MTTVNPPSGSPSPLDKLLASARRLMQAGQFVEAAGAYQKLLSLRPDIAELQNEMGSVLTCQRKFGEAQAHYERALALRPTSPRPTTTWPICCVYRADWKKPWFGMSKSLRSCPTVRTRTTTWATCWRC